MNPEVSINALSVNLKEGLDDANEKLFIDSRRLNFDSLVLSSNRKNSERQKVKKSRLRLGGFKTWNFILVVDANEFTLDALDQIRQNLI